MKGKINILAIIPARGGSKGIPHKNRVMLNGKPLLSYTCEAAKKSKSISRIILSTDDARIAAMGRRHGIEVPFLRPKKYAQDTSSALDVILHTLSYLKKKERYLPDAIIYLQPTSPLRGARHIDEAINLFTKAKHVDSLVSVTPVPHQFNPLSIMKVRKGLLIPFLDEEGFKLLRRQDKPLLYARNGPSILMTKYKVLTKEKSLYGKRILPYIMAHEESIDIDTPYDLMIAECILKNNVWRK